MAEAPGDERRESFLDLRRGGNRCWPWVEHMDERELSSKATRNFVGQNKHPRSLPHAHARHTMATSPTRDRACDTAMVDTSRILFPSFEAA